MIKTCKVRLVKVPLPLFVGLMVPLTNSLIGTDLVGWNCVGCDACLE